MNLISAERIRYVSLIGSIYCNKMAELKPLINANNEEEGAKTN